MNLATYNKSENIKIAEKIILEAGITNFSYTGYSDKYGISVYFKDSKENKIRVSDHSVINTERLFGEIHLSFDMKCRGLGGKISIRDNSFWNKRIVKNWNY